MTCRKASLMTARTLTVIACLLSLILAGCKEASAWPASVTPGTKVYLTLSAGAISDAIEQNAAVSTGRFTRPPAPVPLEVVQVEGHWLHLKAGARTLMIPRDAVDSIRVAAE